LLGAIFLALNLAAVNYFRGQRSRQVASLRAAQTQIAEGNIWIEKAEELPEKSRNLPPLPQFTEFEANESIMAAIPNIASKAGLTVDPTLLNAPQDTIEPAVAVRVKFSGEFSTLVKFLFELQGPTSWRSIENIEIKADAAPRQADSGPPNIQGELVVRQYYTTDGGAPANSAPEQPASEESKSESSSEQTPEATSEPAPEPTPESVAEPTPDAASPAAEE